MADDAVAFRQLFETHFEELCRFVHRYVQSVEESRDLVHDTFLRLWKQRAEVDWGGGTVRSFLFTMARYQALDHLRHKRVEERWKKRYIAPMIVEEGSALPPEAERDLAAGELAAAIQRAVDTLPDRQREVLTLRWRKQASYEEIAEALNISAKTVGVHLMRAIAHLREMLPKVLEEQEEQEQR